MPACEGCGTRTDEDHIKRRSERLELASRFRPARIRVLLLEGAPPSRAADYFYGVGKDRSQRSLDARRYFFELMNAASIASSPDSEDEVLLAEFQRKGFFLAYAVECPFADQDDPRAVMQRLAPTVLRRVQTDYDPAYMVPISMPTTDLLRLFGMVGWGDRLVLDDGAPFIDPYVANPRYRGVPGSALGDRIKKALAYLP